MLGIQFFKTKNAHNYIDWIASMLDKYLKQSEVTGKKKKKNDNTHLTHWIFWRNQSQCVICLSFSPTSSRWPLLSPCKICLNDNVDLSAKEKITEKTERRLISHLIWGEISFTKVRSKSEMHIFPFGSGFPSLFLWYVT